MCMCICVCMYICAYDVSVCLGICVYTYVCLFPDVRIYIYQYNMNNYQLYIYI